ncbi:NAD(P)/FAD-dependent oxidoreductase [Aspergillus saccharolyticus JOP 1030-1]|uniref:FAD/NAD(P)-binding domain-containing protein n=1 Tax=Aspergillus saccharolyticus JOP 1030-1 TaxID=1450539 RepID=A0A318ZDW1_9EURO|nr:FAD/NAD(P)-binding domain-containing protein [Aspergillus saccharolyticus JOP 1030-1]PYH42863.1 FAD/NAD(P)-binding domain-containing protein [Aspergillus saccharolyticus JOP 1030-1]
MPTPPTIVIIGASVAGLPIAHALLKDAHPKKVILINPSRDFWWMIAAPRILTKPSAFQRDQYLVPIESGFAKYTPEQFEFVHGYATALDATKKVVTVSLASGQSPPTTSYEYNYLVIASGSTTPSSIPTDANTPLYPFKAPPLPTPGVDQLDRDLDTLIQTAQQTTTRAKRIVIGGAGPIGIETAGELAELPHRPAITLVSATARVLPGLAEGASAAADAQLRGKGVYIIPGRKVVRFTPANLQAAQPEEDSAGQATTTTPQQPAGGIVELDNGETIETDLYIPTTGVLPNNQFLPAEILDEKGWVKVDAQLRVPGLQGVWAAGDITANSARLAQTAGQQATVAAHNLLVEMTGAGSVKEYAAGKALMVVPVGERGGTGQLWFGWVPWAWFVRLIKGRDFFIAKAKEAVHG